VRLKEAGPYARVERRVEALDAVGRQEEHALVVFEQPQKNAHLHTYAAV